MKAQEFSFQPQCCHLAPILPTQFGAGIPHSIPSPHGYFLLVYVRVCGGIYEQDYFLVPNPHPILNFLSFYPWTSKGNIYPSNLPSIFHSPLLHSRNFTQSLILLLYLSILIPASEMPNYQFLSSIYIPKDGASRGHYAKQTSW